ncbi:MAG: hypothetical protein U0573_04995 [Phycisphaerales bacterium]
MNPPEVFSGPLIDLQPKYTEGEEIKYRWTQTGEDLHSGETITEDLRKNTSSTELEFTLKILRILPGPVYHCEMTFNRVVIEGPVFKGRERYDSKDPRTKNGFFANPAQILLTKPVEFGFAPDSYSYSRKEHPRLRAWNPDGTTFMDNTVGDQAFPARFGPLFGWYAPSAHLGEIWMDRCDIRINSGAAISTERSMKLAKSDGVTLEIDITGKGLSAPESGSKKLKFRESTYEAHYLVNAASNKVRSGNVTHIYTCDYIWKGKPASVTSTVKETLERMD